MLQTSALFLRWVVDECEDVPPGAMRFCLRILKGSEGPMLLEVICLRRQRVGIDDCVVKSVYQPEP